MNRPTLVNHGGFGSETYAREELRAEIAAMMTGEQLGVGHEPRHGTAYVSSWIKALENDPKETRAAAVDAQRSTDWLLARERERSREEDKGEHERSDSDAGQTREPRDPDRPPPEVITGSQANQDTARDREPSPQAFTRAAANERPRDVGPSR